MIARSKYGSQRPEACLKVKENINVIKKYFFSSCKAAR